MLLSLLTKSVQILPCMQRCGSLSDNRTTTFSEIQLSAKVIQRGPFKDERMRNVHMKCCNFYHFLKHLQQFETKRKKKVTNRIDLQFASISKRYINKTHIINISFYKHINSVFFKHKYIYAGEDEVHECTAAAATIYSFAVCSFYTIVHHLVCLYQLTICILYTYLYICIQNCICIYLYDGAL